MKPLPLLPAIRRSLGTAALCMLSTWASASPVLRDVNNNTTPGSLVFGPSTIGWQWTAPLSFLWGGLGSNFHRCWQFKLLSFRQGTPPIATDTPSNGGSSRRFGTDPAVRRPGVCCAQARARHLGLGARRCWGLSLLGLVLVGLVQQGPGYTARHDKQQPG